MSEHLTELDLSGNDIGDSGTCQCVYLPVCVCVCLNMSRLSFLLELVLVLELSIFVCLPLLVLLALLALVVFSCSLRVSLSHYLFFSLTHSFSLSLTALYSLIPHISPTDAGAAALAESLRGNPPHVHSEAGMAVPVAAISAFRGLCKLNLSGNCVRKDGASALAVCLRSNSSF